MKPFSEYITEKAIIDILCKYRARLADVRHKEYIIKALTPNESIIIKKYAELEALLPPRRQWVTLNEKNRYKINSLGNKQVLTSKDANIKRLKITIFKAYKDKSSENWFVNLQKFIDDVKNSIIDPSYKFTPPETIPISKGIIDDKEECRPISIFNSLKDKVILSLANKYLTILFDSYFDEESLAFRSSRKYHNNGDYITTHHDAIDRIMEYRSRHNKKNLYVAECDMQKFYDTVCHKIIKREFNKLIKLVEQAHPEIETGTIKTLFYKYLDCYTFPKNVYKLNHSVEYWKRYSGIKNGFFGWIKEEELISKKICKNNRGIPHLKIGIPQGGALSGLIANIVLNAADKQIRKQGGDFLYMRYCDDMILIHTNKSKCNKILQIYYNALQSLKLVPHPLSPALHFRTSSFWKVKSKSVYHWGELGSDWIGFVGYEIKRTGEIRIRKKSLTKEKTKIKTVTRNICSNILRKKRLTDQSILNTITHKLISMSVGRFALWNYRLIDNEFCWITGFNRLVYNSYASVQLKDLDRVRGNAICAAKRFLKTHKAKIEIKRDAAINIIEYHGRPFSYFYHYSKNGNTID